MRRSLIRGILTVTGIAIAVGLLGLVRSIESPVRAQQPNALNCPVTFDTLKTELGTAATQDSTGLNNNYWAVVVNREGTVCAVAYSGTQRDSQWLLSRQIAAAKAFTANGLSLDSAPISTAMLYPWVQPGAPGNPLFGLAGGNPVSPEAAYEGAYHLFGTRNDPMIGRRVGGTITFGGGLGLYNGTDAIGGLGLSGDTACADHSTAWRLRVRLSLEPSEGDDRITLGDNDHPSCPNDDDTEGAK